MRFKAEGDEEGVSVTLIADDGPWLAFRAPWIQIEPFVSDSYGVRCDVVLPGMRFHVWKLDDAAHLGFARLSDTGRFIGTIEGEVRHYR